MTRIGPFVLDGHTDEHVAVVRDTLTHPLPWWVLLTPWRGHVRVKIGPDRSARFWQSGDITIAPRQMVRWFAHEAGHGLDVFGFGHDLGAKQRWRAQIRETLGVPANQPWTVGAGVKHHDATGESFADWVAYECGVIDWTSWGPHDWSGQATRDRLKGILIAAASEVSVFSDVAGSVHEEAILWAAGQGLVSGKGDGSFAPNEPVTRGQLVSILDG